VLRAAGERKITQGNIQDWILLDERDPEIQLLTVEENAYYYIFNLFFSKILSFKTIFRFTTPDDISPH
jgi:hypothetical protein